MVSSSLLIATLAHGVAGGNPPGTYAHYSGLPSGTSKDMEVDHFWVSMPTPDETQGNAVFGSMQYWMESGPGGYFGSQVWRVGADPSLWRNGSRNLLGSKIGASETHRVLFSMWDADASHQVSWEGDTCERFGGEGVGSHCLITYPMTQGVKYTMRVVMSDDQRKMTGYVTDTSTGVQTKIGTLVYPDYNGNQGFGLIKLAGSAFQEYFLSSDCENQPLSAVGLIGPFFSDRSVVPTGATGSYHGSCQHADVHSCIQPGEQCGPSHVMLLAGGTVEQKTAANTQLWQQPYPGSEVSCGAHHSDACQNCDQGRGASWCNGDCVWAGSSCSPKSVVV